MIGPRPIIHSVQIIPSPLPCQKVRNWSWSWDFIIIRCSLAGPSFICPPSITIRRHLSHSSAERSVAFSDLFCPWRWARFTPATFLCWKLLRCRGLMKMLYRTTSHPPFKIEILPTKINQRTWKVDVYIKNLGTGHQNIPQIDVVNLRNSSVWVQRDFLNPRTSTLISRRFRLVSSILIYWFPKKDCSIIYQ